MCLCTMCSNIDVIFFSCLLYSTHWIRGKNGVCLTMKKADKKGKSGISMTQQYLWLSNALKTKICIQKTKIHSLSNQLLLSYIKSHIATIGERACARMSPCIRHSNSINKLNHLPCECVQNWASDRNTSTPKYIGRLSHSVFYHISFLFLAISLCILFNECVIPSWSRVYFNSQYVQRRKQYVQQRK